MVMMMATMMMMVVMVMMMATMMMMVVMVMVMHTAQGQPENKTWALLQVFWPQLPNGVKGKNCFCLIG